jgi:hypothetical protein
MIVLLLALLVQVVNVEDLEPRFAAELLACTVPRPLTASEVNATDFHTAMSNISQVNCNGVPYSRTLSH